MLLGGLGRLGFEIRLSRIVFRFIVFRFNAVGVEAKMIFSAKNDKGVPLWKLVLDGTKTVTRRRSSQPVGAVRAVQAERCRKEVGKIQVVSCQLDCAWFDLSRRNVQGNWNLFLKYEAKKEGFSSWENLWKAINKIYPKGVPTLYRIEFKLQGESKEKVKRK